MKTIKRFAAIALALLMAISMPLVALAEGADANFTLTFNTTQLYAGMTYDVVAEITDASAALATGNTAFTWSVSSTAGAATITSKNNYSAKKNEDGTTYTVTETASFTMPEAGAKLTVTASLGSRTKSSSADSLQPIESYTVEFENTEHAYYDETNNTLYVDRKSKSASLDEFLNISIKDITPAESDDGINIALSGIAYNKYTLDMNEGTAHLTFNTDTTGSGTVAFSTVSGKTPKNYKLQVCVPFSSYTLSHTSNNATVSSIGDFAKVQDIVEETRTGLNAIAGKDFTITAKKSNSEGNDDMSYTLYTDYECTNKALEKYWTSEGMACHLSIDVAGTYYLKCQNKSKDNGKLTRQLKPCIVALTVNQAYPIQNIDLFKLDDEGARTNEKLEKITLYTNASTDKMTYALNKSVSLTPVDNTDAVSYMSSNTKVAKVDAKTGLITAVGKGETTVWVSSADNPEAIASVTVEVKIGVKSITGIENSDGITDIPSGHVVKFNAVTDPSVVDDAIYWSTTNPEVLSINSATGEATAATVSEKTSLYVIATTESGKSNRFPFNVVPAIRAKSVSLTVTSESATMTEDKSGTYALYSDYNVSSLKPFVITADVQSESGEPSNDKLMWSVTYDNGVGMSFEEAAAAGYLKYTTPSATSTNKTVYYVTPLKPELFTITCISTLNEADVKPSDPFDAVMLKLKNPATEIKVINENTGSTLSGSSTVNIPIGGSVDITVKTSTIDNDKYADPPKYEITAGAEFVNVTSKPSADGEGVTYTIKGLEYATTTTKIKFSSTSGSKSVTPSFPVRNNIADAEVTGIENEVEYTGSAITFKNLTLKVNGSTLDTSNYSVAYSNNKNAGEATITITGKSYYVGSVKVLHFTITPLSLAGAEIEKCDDRTITDKTKEFFPKPYVKVNGVKLKLDTDYTFVYKNNDRAGLGDVIVVGKGNYTGTAQTTVNIYDDVSRCAISSIGMQTYTGRALTPAVSVKYRGAALTKGKDYTVTYTSNVNVGTASVKIEGKGFFKGSVTKTFIIRPKKEKLKSVKAVKKGFNAKWASQANVSGYQVQYAMNSKFTKKKKSVNIAAGTTSYKKTGLKKKKYYYVRVRSYVVINGAKVYGAWSASKKVKTK